MRQHVHKLAFCFRKAATQILHTSISQLLQQACSQHRAQYSVPLLASSWNSVQLKDLESTSRHSCRAADSRRSSERLGYGVAREFGRDGASGTSHPRPLHHNSITTDGHCPRTVAEGSTIVILSSGSVPRVSSQQHGKEGYEERCHCR